MRIKEQLGIICELSVFCLWAYQVESETLNDQACHGCYDPVNGGDLDEESTL